MQKITVVKDGRELEINDAPGALKAMEKSGWSKVPRETSNFKPNLKKKSIK